MRELLAVSVPPGASPARLLARMPQAIRQLGGSGDTITHRFDDSWVAFADPAGDDQLPDGPGSGFSVRLTRSMRTPESDAVPADLDAILGDGSRPDGQALARFLPPFAAAHRSSTGGPTVVAGDWLGLRQLFWWRADDGAAVSTNALALGTLAGARWDESALQVQSLLGWQVGLATAISGVTKLAPGCVAVLHRGLVDVRQYAEPSLATGAASASLDTVVDELAGILRDLLGRYLVDHPKAQLQLSGGQDSRLLLCAVPPELRAGLPAMTLDVHGGAESRVAIQLRDACGLAHDLHWLDEWPAVDAATGYQVAIEAATAMGGLASPLAQGSLTLIEARLEQGHRLSGTGGETARGFYYPGQPHQATTSRRLIRRLADWRLFTNEAVELAALDPDFAAGARAAALDAIGTCFDSYDPDWLRATDEFYLWQRVQRWAGAHDTVAAVDRHDLNPLLDRRFMRLALSLPPADKRHSQLTGRLMQRLSPELAAIPLDSGLVPARLARGGPAGTAAVIRTTARKVAGKVLQRVRGSRRNQLGAAELAALVVTHWRAHPDLLKPLRQTGLVRDDWLDELLDGRRGAPATTVAFLINLLVVAEATDPH